MDGMVELWSKILYLGCPSLKVHSTIVCGTPHKRFFAATIIILIIIIIVITMTVNVRLLCFWVHIIQRNLATR